MVRGLDVPLLGVGFRMDGLVCGFDSKLLNKCFFANFTAERQVASVASLARPLRVFHSLDPRDLFAPHCILPCTRSQSL